MAFPASQQRLATALDAASTAALRLRSEVKRLRDASEVGAVSRRAVIEIQRELDKAIQKWNQASAVPGIATYAQDQYGDAGLDVAAEFTAMVSAATSLRDWIHGAFPRDADTGAVLLSTLNPDGTLTDLTFSPAQLAEFRTRADQVIASIV